MLENSSHSNALRNHKDTLFRFIFKDKKNLLDLYNALNNTNHTNVDDLEITTIEDILYLTFKNDLSLIIEDVLGLYEHQSSYNPNMPLRGLFYFAQLYNKYRNECKLNIYSKKLIKLPTPVYIVFYNGIEEYADVKYLRLSSSFGNMNVEPCLECTAKMLNINYGHNRELMNKCKMLADYARFIAIIREKTRGITDPQAFNTSINEAVDEAISKGILVDILSRNRAEVIEMINSDEDLKLHIECEKKESHDEGYEEGRIQGELIVILTAIKRNISRNKSLGDIADGLAMEVSEIKDYYNVISANPDLSIEELIGLIDKQ